MPSIPYRPTYALILALLASGVLFAFEPMAAGLQSWVRYLLPFIVVYLWGRPRELYISSAFSSLLIAAGMWLELTPSLLAVVDFVLLPILGLWAFAFISVQRLEAQQTLARNQAELGRQVAEALRHSEDRFAKIFHTSPGPVAISRQSDGVLVEVNQAFQDLVGYRRDELLNHTIMELGIMPADTRATIAAAVQAQGYARGMEMHWTAAGGAARDVLSNIEQIQFDGESCYLVALFDVTERLRAAEQVREAYQRLQLALDAAAIGVWNWNFADDSLDWDDRMCELYGVPVSTGAGGLRYELWRSRLHPDDLAYAESTLMAAVKDDAPWQIRFRIILADGKVRHVHTSAVIDHDRQGVPLRMIGINRDITGQIEYEQLLQDTNAVLERHVAQRTADLQFALAELQRAGKLKDEFMAMISHELRTPLVGVLSMAELLDAQVAGPLSPRQAVYVQNIRLSGDRLLDIINNIIGYTQLISGQVELRCEPCDLGYLLNTCAASQRTKAAARLQTVEVEVTPRDITIDSDPTALAEVLKRLLDNAIKFTPERGRIGLAVHPTPAKLSNASPPALPAHGMAVDIVVWDTGAGIAPDQLARIREPFTQLDASLARSHDGLGLGLAYVDAMVRMLGGGLAVESAVGQGSCFTITLPQQLAKHQPFTAQPAAA